MGEVVLEGKLLLWHELPRPGLVAGDDAHPLAERFARFFAGERDDVPRRRDRSRGGDSLPAGGGRSAAPDPVRGGRHLRRARCPRRAPRRALGPWVSSARTTASRSSSRATASSPRTGSARTARSEPTTSAACWRSKVPLSEDLRTELAAIEPRKACDRLAELSGLFHSAGSLHLRGTGRGRRSPRPLELRRGAPCLHAAAPAGGADRDPHVPAARLWPGDPVSAARRGRGSRAAGAARGGRRVGGARADRPAAEAGRREGLLPRRVSPGSLARVRDALGAAVAAPGDPGGLAGRSRAARGDRRAHRPGAGPARRRVRQRCGSHCGRARYSRGQ